MAEGLLIIPAYNEEKNIGQVLKNLKLSKLDLDIIVINDGSKDRTKEVVEEESISIISHPYNLGYAAALQTGFKYAQNKGYNYVIQFDSDGQHDINDIPFMMGELEKGHADIVIGSRFIGKGSFKAGFLKRIVISFMRFLIKLLAKERVTDPTSGLKGLSKRTYVFYSKMSNFPNDYPDADILIRMIRMGYKVYEIPIDVKERTQGKSMHSGIKPIIYLLKILLSIAVIILREKLVKES